MSTPTVEILATDASNVIDNNPDTMIYTAPLSADRVTRMGGDIDADVWEEDQRREPRWVDEDDAEVMDDLGMVSPIRSLRGQLLPLPLFPFPAISAFWQSCSFHHRNRQ